MSGDGDAEDSRPKRSVSLGRVTALLKEERKSILKDVVGILTSDLTESLTLTLTESLLTKIEKSLSDKIGEAIKSGFDKIQSNVEKVEVEVAQNTSDILLIKSAIEQLESASAEHKQEIERLSLENDVLKKQISEFSADRISKLEERIEERTNRQLRQTLVFKNIDERGGKEKDWSVTKDVLAETISSTLDISFDSAYDMINRCHRSAPNPRKNGRRDIYANFFCWEDTESIVKCFRRNNIEFKHFNINASYKYGPLTTARRGQALLARKDLKAEGKITKGFLKYPAQLFVMYTGEEKYKPHEDFSKMEVNLDRY